MNSPHQSCDSMIKSCKMEEVKSTNGTNVCCNIKRDKYPELRFIKKNICHVIKSFPELKQNSGKEYITFTLSSSSIAI